MFVYSWQLKLVFDAIPCTLQYAIQQMNWKGGKIYGQKEEDFQVSCSNLEINFVLNLLDIFVYDW